MRCTCLKGVEGAAGGYRQRDRGAVWRHADRWPKVCLVFLPLAFNDAYGLLMLVLVLLFRPAGLFGGGDASASACVVVVQSRLSRRSPRTTSCCRCSRSRLSWASLPSASTSSTASRANSTLFHAAVSVGRTPPTSPRWPTGPSPSGWEQPSRWAAWPWSRCSWASCASLQAQGVLLRGRDPGLRRK